MKYLIFGLGNTGSEYRNTRHNIGFQVLDALAEASNAFFEPSRHADVTTVKKKGRSLILVKPTTLMNLSGKAVNYWMKEEKVPLDRILIVTDDISLPLGKLRLRKKGGDGGHNGLADIIQRIGSRDFARLRFGVGNDFPRGKQVEFVLGKWTQEEEKVLPERIELANEMIQDFAFRGVDKTMNAYNNK